ncbi:hypothetical protein MMC25_004753 [Agyrium rufum]|nr:hypothetical protein [Agyrium rufum]
MDDTTEDSDDLEITNVVRRTLQKGKAPARTTIQETSEYRDNAGTRVEWSGDDVDTVYDRIKERQKKKQKKIAPAPRRIKDTGTSIVGKRVKRVKHEQRANGDMEDSDEDEGIMEYDLPDYLQNRRAKFEDRRATLKAAGLKLPPTYEDVYFSDEDDLEDLPEKPVFPKGEPSGPYEDIPLPYSLGLIPAPTATWLRDYQKEGVSFLHKHFVYQDGCILGDDMGLGKTIQVIAFLTAAFGKTGDLRDAKRMRKMRRIDPQPWYPKVLIVCPGTLIENWKAEFSHWGWWHVDVFHGDTKEFALQSATSGRLEVMITTYTTYRMKKSAINVVEWDCVIADECHQIKGRHSETTKAMNEVNALCRIGLTGTAIQNTYDELWTLLNWTNPGRFGPISDWKKSVSIPLKMGQSHDATVYQLSKARKTAKLLVQNLLPQFFLRRMKSLIAHQLPKKSDRVVFCPLTITQAEAYENCLDGEVIQTIKQSASPCECGSGKKAGFCCHMHLSDGSKWQSSVFPAILGLQRVANHLGLLIPQGADPPEKQGKDLALLETALPDQARELYRNRDSILNYSKSEFCGKWKVLSKLLKFWHQHEDKVLIFSHSVRLLKMLQALFTHTAYNVSFLDGSMSYEDRAKAVDDFNSDPAQFVFLISTKAGGVGLNIVSANKVVIVDPNWNPSYDLQAQDRAYRIGQVRDVEVFRLVSAGTIEEIVYARQIYKQQQANIGYTASNERRYFKGVQDQKDQKGEIFGLANLFAYAGDNVVLRDIVNKTNVAESKIGISVVGCDLPSGDDGKEEDDPLLTSDDENGAMSQLSAIIAAENEKEAMEKSQQKIKIKAKKSDPISAILANAGVSYTHENGEVIGSSKVETHLSRRAEETAAMGADSKVIDRHVFDSTQEKEEPRRSSRYNSDGREIESSDDEKLEYRYHPPEDVMKRQFCSMAKHFGFSDACKFALVVESWTQAQRRNCLDKFYASRRETLKKRGREGF